MIEVWLDALEHVVWLMIPCSSKYIEVQNFGTLHHHHYIAPVLRHCTEFQQIYEISEKPGSLHF